MRPAAWILMALVLAGAAASAQERPAVVVTPGATRSYRAAVQTFADTSSPKDPAADAAMRRGIEAGLEYSSLFQILSQEAFLGPEETFSLDQGPPPTCSDWTQIGADALVEGQIERGPELRVEFRVWDVARCVRLLRKLYRQPASADPMLIARRIADDIVGAFTGVRGVASTEIAFVSNRRGNPEIYVMGADGSNQRAATANHSLNNFPDWSPDGESIVYTSYRYKNRPLLFLSTRGRGRPGELLRRLRGTWAQYRGVYAPQGDRLAVVMSRPDSVTDLYSVRQDGSDLKQLTRDPAIEVAPTWSPDAKRLAFVSDRTGAPQIYVMNADGSDVRRLTFQGSYNSHPAWSPDGRWIAYETRVGGQFDIWLIDPEGGSGVPLITNPRSDESPAWSADGRKLAFSSTRRGRADIYVVDVTGDNLRRLTEGKGENTSPSWGPFPR